MKHLLFAYNPVAGQAKIQKQLFEVVNYYDSQDYTVTLCPLIKLQSRWDELTEHTTFDRIVCSGGDGSLNMLMTFMTQKGISMDVGYLPAGSTNDYAHSLGISNQLEQALSQSIHGESHAYDIGKLGDVHFLYVAGFGIFTSVTYTTPQKIKNLLGHTAYILEGIKQLSDVQSYQIRVEADDQVVEGSFILGLVTNSLFVGGIKDILPADSALDDGKFEVLLLRTPANLLELQEIVLSLSMGNWETNPNVILLKSSTLKIYSEEKIDWTVDGEFGGSYQETTILNLHKAFRVIR